MNTESQGTIVKERSIKDFERRKSNENQEKSTTDTKPKHCVKILQCEHRHENRKSAATFGKAHAVGSCGKNILSG